MTDYELRDFLREIARRAEAEDVPPTEYLARELECLDTARGAGAEHLEDDEQTLPS